MMQIKKSMLKDVRMAFIRTSFFYSYISEIPDINDKNNRINSL